MTLLSIPHVHLGHGDFDLLARLEATLSAWRRRSHNRHFLAQLDRHQRAHLGAPLNAVERELAKPFWRE